MPGTRHARVASDLTPAPKKEHPPLAEPLLITEATAPSQSTEAPSRPTGTAPPRPHPKTAQAPGLAPRPAAVPNARKGYKLTLWVSAMTEAGLADVHGLLQLDGADPIPFCQLKGVPNPLGRALQEAFVAVERVRARPPRMSAPPAAAAAPSGARPQAAVPSAR